MKPDYLPNYINPQVIHEVMSDLNREKELIDERSHSLQVHRGFGKPEYRCEK